MMKLEVEVCLGEFTDAQIGEEMVRLAGLLRGDAVAEPQRRGKGKESETLSLLDALSAMRLASHYPKTLPQQPCVSRREKRKRPRGAETAVSKFNDIRLGGISSCLRSEKSWGAILGTMSLTGMPRVGGGSFR